MTDFGRLVTAMVTPFDDQLKVNWDQLEKLIDYLIVEQKNDTLVVSGTTGESPTLTDDEKIQLFEAAAKFARGRCKIIAGTGSNETAHTVHLTRQAERIGVDGVLIVAPYYNRPSQEGVYQHFKAAAEATPLPVMIYNIPSRTGINISPETLLRIAELPNVVATKESHNDFDHITKLIAHAPADFKVYCGDDPLTVPYLSLGAYGVVSVAGHIVGARIKEMVYAYLDGKVNEARQIHFELHPIFKGLFECPHRVPSPAPVKHALNVKGLNVGGVRLPLVSVTEAEARFIEQLL